MTLGLYKTIWRVARSQRAQLAVSNTKDEMCHERGTEGSNRMVLTPSLVHVRSALLILVKCTQTKNPTSTNCAKKQLLTHVSPVKQNQECPKSWNRWLLQTPRTTETPLNMLLWIPGIWTVRWASTARTWDKIKMALLSRCYLRPSWRLKSLGTKNVSLIVDIKKARFMDHNKNQHGSCAETSSDLVKVIPSGEIMTTNSQSMNPGNTLTQEQTNTEHVD